MLARPPNSRPVLNIYTRRNLGNAFSALERGSFETMVGHALKSLIFEHLAERKNDRAFHILYPPLRSATVSCRFRAVYSGHKLATRKVNRFYGVV